MDDDDIGTVRWFGDSWHAPINDPRAQIDPPVDQRCVSCRKWIESDSEGITTVASTSIDPSGRAAYHLKCFFYEIGAVHG